MKSMLGERATRLAVDGRGVVGDRLWSVRTDPNKIASGKTTRRFEALPKVLELRAQERDGTLIVTFPDGSRCTVEDPSATERLSRHVGQPVTIARETGVSHFDDGPISVIGRASVLAVTEERGVPVDPSRFRPNVIIDATEPFAEDEWVGRQLKIGTAVFSVTMTSPRCAMVDMKTADLPSQPGNLLAVGRVNHAHLGVIASVEVPGVVRVGDKVRVGVA